MNSAEVWYLYVVACNDGTLYTGICKDVARRLSEHNAGRGARYTASRRPVLLRAVWRFPDFPSAIKAEVALKRRTRAAKLQVVEGGADYRGGVRESTG
jgi:putative endonuclease